MEKRSKIVRDIFAWVAEISRGIRDSALTAGGKDELKLLVIFLIMCQRFQEESQIARFWYFLLMIELLVNR